MQTGIWPLQHRLAAILAADVVGYSRLMSSNEVGTLTALKAHRQELIDQAIAAHHGRIVKLTGDGILAEFASVTGALHAALQIQRDMPRRNAHVPDDRRILFRVGINLGEIIFEDGDIFGDGVNIAARIEALARPGGIAVSGAVHDQVRNQIDVGFDPGGEQRLKNIAQPVHVFHVALGPAAPADDAGLSERPSVAVLPFANISGDPEQAYFADGITEDIITDLSKISGLFVVGRNSVFVYKDKPVNLRTVARELGVRYILEGSVRKAGQRVRITGQLIDGATGGHLWADRYDRDLTDIFAVQDEIARTIIDQLQVRLLTGEASAIDRIPTRSVDAYTCYLQGRQLAHMRSRKFVEAGRRLFEKAIEYDPNYARAYAGIADCDSFSSNWFGTKLPSATILATANRALALDPDLAEAHASRGLALQFAGRRDEALAAFDRALAIDPACYEAHQYLARFHLVAADYDKSTHHFTRSLEIRPDDYRSPLMLASLFNAQARDPVKCERYLKLGLRRAEEAAERNPDHADPLELGAATLATAGHAEQARDWVRRALAIEPTAPNAPRYNIACAYAQLGEFDKALDLLEIVVAHAGADSLDWLRWDSDLDPLRDHPRLAQLLGDVD